MALHTLVHVELLLPLPRLGLVGGHPVVFLLLQGQMVRVAHLLAGEQGAVPGFVDTAQYRQVFLGVSGGYYREVVLLGL